MGKEWPFAPPCTSAGVRPAICSTMHQHMGATCSALCQHIGDDLLIALPCMNAWAMTHQCDLPSTNKPAMTCHWPHPASGHGSWPTSCRALLPKSSTGYWLPALPCANAMTITCHWPETFYLEQQCKKTKATLKGRELSRQHSNEPLLEDLESMPRTTPSAAKPTLPPLCRAYPSPAV